MGGLPDWVKTKEDYEKWKLEKSPTAAETITFDNKEDSISNEVIVKDIQMKFGSMVVFMVKWVIASIPALIILVLIGVVVGLIFGGIFGGIGGYKSASAKADKIEEARAQIELIGYALDAHKLDTGKYPSTQEGLQSLLVNPGIEHWGGPYLRESSSLVDPWGNPYIYASPGIHGDFDILSLGADGKEGGSGKDADIKSWR